MDCTIPIKESKNFERSDFSSCEKKRKVLDEFSVVPLHKEKTNNRPIDLSNDDDKRKILKSSRKRRNIDLTIKNDLEKYKHQQLSTEQLCLDKSKRKYEAMSGRIKIHDQSSLREEIKKKIKTVSSKKSLKECSGPESSSANINTHTVKNSRSKLLASSSRLNKIVKPVKNFGTGIPKIKKNIKIRPSSNRKEKNKPETSSSFLALETTKVCKFDVDYTECKLKTNISLSKYDNTTPNKAAHSSGTCKAHNSAKCKVCEDKTYQSLIGLNDKNAQSSENPKSLTVAPNQVCLADLIHFDIKLENSQNLIVVDTNVLLENKDILVVSKGKPYMNKPVTFFIPFIVLQELDILKNKKSVQHKAQNTIKWVNSLLSIEDPYIIGQSFESHVHACSIFITEKADDTILNCCLLLKQTGRLTQLLSNDVNLRNKAIVSGIKSFNAIHFERLFLNFKETIEPEIKLSDQEIRKCDLSVSVSAKEDNRDSTLLINDNLKEKTGVFSKNISLYDGITLSTMEDYIKLCLGAVLKCAMIDCYGENLWELIVMHKPPWTPLQILKCFEKHWRAVFFDKFSNDFLTIIKILVNHFSCDLGLNSGGPLVDVAKKLSLLSLLVKNDPYRSLMKLFPPRKENNNADPSCSYDGRASQLSHCYSVEHLENEVKPSHTKLSFDLSSRSSLSPFLNIQNTIVEVGLHAMHLKTTLLQSLDKKNPKSESSRIDLTSLRTFLVSFGFTLKSTIENSQSPHEPSILDQIHYFWVNTPQEAPVMFQWSREMEIQFSKTSEGSQFLYSCLSDLENLIQSIDAAILM